MPIVAIMGDPIGTGLAVSLAGPGGNITGISTLAFGIYVMLGHARKKTHGCTMNTTAQSFGLAG